MNLALLAKYGPSIFQGIKDGIDIYERLRAGDQSAEEAAKDWLGITADVEEAIKNWNESKS